MEELSSTLKCCHNTAVGADGIHYEFLKCSPHIVLLLLLEIFNTIWRTGDIPQSWKEAIIIPIPKPGKGYSDINNYRPIALTSCLCKTIERMFNNRLLWILDSGHKINEYQCGFRWGKSTLDHLIRIESFLQDTFIKKVHAVAVFFDLEKAYDTTWRYDVLKDLYEIGLRGNWPIFISNFLSQMFLCS